MNNAPTIQDTAQKLADNLAAGNSPFPDTVLQVGHDNIAHLENKEHSVLEQANAITIRDQETYDRAGRFVLEYIKPLEREIKDTFGPIIAENETTKRAATEALRVSRAKQDEHLEPLQTAKRVAITKCKMYEDEQARVRREEQHRLELAQKRAAEEEVLKAATQAEQMGEAPEVVDAILEEKVERPAVIAPPTFERMKGVTRKAPPKAEVVSKLALDRFVADNPRYSNLTDANMPALNAMARSLGTQFNVPGVKISH